MFITFLALAIAAASPTTRMLVVSINGHSNRLPHLQAANVDAAALVAAITAHGEGAVTVVRLSDAATDSTRLATKVNFDRWFANILAESAPDDSLIVALFGHAVGGRFVPSDGDPDRPETLIPVAAVEAAVRDARSRNRWAIFDCCRREGGRGAPPAGPIRVDLDSVTRPRQFLTAGTFLVTHGCSEGEFAYEQPDGGAFGRHLAEGLRGAADDDANGAVTHDELVRYLVRVVPTYVKRHWNADQRPHVRVDSNGPWVLARTRHPPPIRRDGAALITPFLAVRRVPNGAPGTVDVAVVLLMDASGPLAGQTVTLLYCRPGSEDVTTAVTTDAEGLARFPVVAEAGQSLFATHKCDRGTCEAKIVLWDGHTFN